MFATIFLLGLPTNASILSRIRAVRSAIAAIFQGAHL